MAMIDFGAVVFKNGKCINKGQFFMDMFDAVGWIDQPRKRYEDCDHLCLGKSSCFDCPRANYVTKNFGYGDVSSFVSDCRGSSKFERGIDGNYFAYIGDEHLTVCFYKRRVLFVLDGKCGDEIWDCFGDNQLSYRGNVDGVAFHIKYIGEGALWFSMTYKGDHYNVIYGNGIDPDVNVWNRVKYSYLGKKVAKKVDRLYERFGGFES